MSWPWAFSSGETVTIFGWVEALPVLGMEVEKLRMRRGRSFEVEVKGRRRRVSILGGRKNFCLFLEMKRFCLLGWVEEG